MKKLCMLINLTLLQINPGDAALGLAPLIRDNCVYAGLSDPVTLGPDVYSGFRQAEIALDYIRRKIGELIAVNLDDPDVRPHLQIAFHFIE